jgi:hypothetical protein
MSGHSPTSICLYETTAMEAKILMDPNFYKRIQRLKYDHLLLNNICTHYSAHDLHYSMLMADLFLLYLNETDKIDNLAFFFKVKHRLCSISRPSWTSATIYNRSGFSGCSAYRSSEQPRDKATA